MNVFYSNDIKLNNIILSGQEARHCSKVLRKGVGAQIYVVDGMGTRFHCEIIRINRDTVELLIIDKHLVVRNPNLPHLAFGLLKNSSRLEILLEKVTEIGVSRITPLICKRSERSKINKDRLQKIVISAMKQSLQYYLPILDEPMKFNDFINAFHSDQRFVASQGDQVPELSVLRQVNKPAIMLIGPEGDFTQEELDLAISSDYKRVNLGENRLRTETAGILACTLLRY